MELLKSIAVWANILFSGALLGLFCIIGFSMLLQKTTKLGKYWVSTLAFCVALLINTILGGYGLNEGQGLATGRPIFRQAFNLILPGFTLAWLLVMFGVGRKTAEE